MALLFAWTILWRVARAGDEDVAGIACLSERLAAQFVEGELDGAQRAQVEAHLDTCEACLYWIAGLVRAAPINRASAFADTLPLADPLTETMSAALSTAALPRRQVGRYVVERLVGAGAMGVVYAAHDPVLGRKVALKLLRNSGSAAATQVRWRLFREAHAMAKLTHPNVVTVHDLGFAGDQLFVAMELVDGVTLRQWLAAERRSWPDVLRVFIAAGHGLIAAHTAGLVHRDFKPDNVFIGDGRVRVGDFGLAWAVGDREDTACVGTPAYMSPEQFRGTAVDVRADVFSFSVALYEALYAQTPFAGDDFDTRKEAVLAGTVRAPPVDSEVPESLWLVVQRGLALGLDTRWPSMQPLIEALARILDSAEERLTNASAGASTLFQMRTLKALVDEIESLRAARSAKSTADIAPPEAAPPSAIALHSNRWARRRRWLWWLASAAAVALFATFTAMHRPLHRTAVVRPTPDRLTPIESPHEFPSTGARHQSGSRGSRGIAMTDHAPPAATSVEAVRAYRNGIEAFRDGRLDATHDALERAVTLDPSLPAAHLRRAILSACNLEIGRDGFRKALALRASLDARDQGLLDAWEPMFLRQPADGDEALRRIRALAGRFPDDAEVAANVAVMMGCGNFADFASQVRQWDIALALDPGAGFAWATRAGARLYLGDTAGARSDVDRCLAAVPSATMCMRVRVHLDATSGECAALEQDARRWLTVEPEAPDALGILAEALASEGRPLAAVREAQRRMRTGLPESRRLLAEALQARILATLVGDFTSAAQHAQTVQQLVAASGEQYEHAMAAEAQASLFEEMGRSDDARRTAADFLARRDAWEPNPLHDDWALGEDPTAFLLGIERRAGAIDAQGFARERDARLAWWEQHERHARGFLWGIFYARAVATPEEAREALSALPRFAPWPRDAPSLIFGDAALGRTLLLGGRAAEALPILERAARACYALRFPIEHVRASLDLGEARARTGDTRGACASWRAVLDHWGARRPHSVTADQARARMAELGCRR